MRAPILVVAGLLTFLLVASSSGVARAATTVTAVAIDHAVTAGDEAGPGDVVRVTLQRAAPPEKDTYDVYWGNLKLPVVAQGASGTDVVAFSIPASTRTDEGPWTEIRAQQRRQPVAPLSVAGADGVRSGGNLSLRLYFPVVVRNVAVHNGGGRAANLGDTLDITLDDGGLKTLRQRPAVLRSPLGLLVGGHFLGGNIVDQPTPDTVTVTLDRRDDNRAAWAPILELRNHFWSSLDAPIALGTADSSEQTTSHLLLISPWGAKPVWALIGLVAIFAVALVILLRSNLARDTVNPQTGRAPYSLGRTQLFFWVTNAMLAAVAVWLVTGDKLIPGGLLVALGIGGGTTLGSRVIDKSMWGSALEAHKDTIQKAIGEAKSLANLDKVKELEQKLKDAIERHVHPHAPSSENFFRDILTGVEGDALYRYQLVAWTLIIIIQFWGAVLSHVELADLDATRLALMGMSAGTYLGLKLPEKPPV
ncbi:MAG TPA: hypothetical protein VIF09_09310 [Polyangiaceae bacterium]